MTSARPLWHIYFAVHLVHLLEVTVMLILYLIVVVEQSGTPIIRLSPLFLVLILARLSCVVLPVEKASVILLPSILEGWVCSIRRILCNTRRFFARSWRSCHSNRRRNFPSTWFQHDLTSLFWLCWIFPLIYWNGFLCFYYLLPRKSFRGFWSCLVLTARSLFLTLTL